MAEQTTLFDAGQTVLGTERRVWVRFGNRQEISGRSVTSSIKDEVDTAWFGLIRNVSPTGIALSMSRRFELGAALILELSAKPEGVLRLPVRVVHATREKKERWLLGCSFVSPLSEEDLLTCLRE
jgi:hypothetical protein